MTHCTTRDTHPTSLLFILSIRLEVPLLIISSIKLAALEVPLLIASSIRLAAPPLALSIRLPVAPLNLVSKKLFVRRPWLYITVGRIP